MEIIELLESTFLGKCVLTLLLSMVPVIELRGAIPMSAVFGLPVLTGTLLSIIGNLIPVPFIIIFVRRVFGWMRRKSTKLGKLADRFERRAKLKGAKLYRGELIGLMVFVAIPLPGTGAWTGALIAAILDIRLKAALPAITAGVITAGILVSGITFGFKELFFS